MGKGGAAFFIFLPFAYPPFPIHSYTNYFEKNIFKLPFHAYI